MANAVRSRVRRLAGEDVAERRALPRLLLAAAMVAAAALILYLTRRTTFYYDEWSFVIQRQAWTPDVLLEPHNEHISVLPVLVYKLLFVTVGLDAYWVFRLVGMLVHLTCAALVFVHVERRLGGWAALAATLPVLFLGRAGEDVLWPFQIGFMGSVAAGLGALLALDRRADRTAGALLVVSLSCSSLGVPFALGVAVEIAWRREWRRVAVAGVPLALYAIWYATYGRSAIRDPDVLGALRWAVEAAVASTAAIVGLGPAAGYLLLPVLLALLGFRLVKAPPTARLLGLLVTAASFWVLTALARMDISAPNTSRYMYIGAITIILAAAEALAGYPRRVRIEGRLALVAVAVGALAAVSSLPELRTDGRFFRTRGDRVAAELGAVELLGERAATGVSPDPRYLPQVDAENYLAAVRRYGSSPAYSPAELPSAGPAARAEADRVLIGLGGIALTAGGAGPRACRTLSAGEIALPGNAAFVGGSAPATLSLRRFGDAGTRVGTLPAHGRARLTVPRDSARAPWRLTIATAAPLRVCTARR